MASSSGSTGQRSPYQRESSDIGLALVVANSIAVASAGLIGHLLLRAADRNVGVGYLAARVAEAVLLLGGILMAELADVGGS
jgi:hypothetical protein